ncbi:hypothetical protein LJK87_41945 [Paenibacillus sp. P25]|nr:hypothetical protein LJK87_41945 [Paenibacillus sp. P25]
MIRLFQTNRIRKITELEGMWDFAVVEEAVRERPEFKYRSPVPGCWEMHPEPLTYRGKGLYRKTLEVPVKTTLRLVFKGVSHTASVFFDGKPVAEHYNAYTAFSAIVRDVAPGTHEIAVLVDNGFHEGSSLHVPNDYYTYGGLIRPVAVEEIGDLFIERIGFIPVLDGGGWRADIQAAVRNTSGEEREFTLLGELAGQERVSAPPVLRPAPSWC